MEQNGENLRETVKNLKSSEIKLGRSLQPLILPTFGPRDCEHVVQYLA